MPESDPETAPERAPDLPARGSSYLPPSVMQERQRQSQKLLLLVVRLLFMVMLVTVTLLTIASESQSPEEFDTTTVIGLFVAAVAVGSVVLLVDAMSPNKRLTSVVGVYLGVCVGLLGAVAVGALIDVVAEAWDLMRSDRLSTYIGLGKVVIAIVLCYLGVSIVLTTKDDFRLVIPYVEFARQVRGVRPMLLDTSVLVDGRIDAFGQTGFVDAPLIVPRFVIEELQQLADSGDKLKRARGRRGLNMVTKLQENPYLDVSIDETESHGATVDNMLLEMASAQSMRILTTDYNLNKVARIRGVTVLNINDVVNSMKSQAIPGEVLAVEIVKRGETAEQGVGYLPDGTMVVIEEAADHIGEVVSLVVTNSLQTSAGRMIFGRFDSSESEDARLQMLADRATSQPRTTEPPERTEHARSKRNPRRA